MTKPAILPSSAINLLGSISLIDLREAACGPPVDPEIFFGLERVRLAVHICWAHCPIRRKCERWATEWYIQGAFSEPTIMGGKVWGAGKRKNFYTQPGAGCCPICDDDYSANIHLNGKPIPRRKRAADEHTPPDERTRHQEPDRIG